MISNIPSRYINTNLTAKNNIEEKLFLPAEIWCHIVSFCDVNTALSISRLCKYIYFATKEDLQRKIELAFYCKRIPDNCHAYSIKNYKEFIAPILENLDAKTKNSIDLHLDKLKNIKITPTIENAFSAFIFKQLANTARIIPKSTSVINELEITEVLECIVNFSSNCYAIRFVRSQNKIHIYQFNFQKNIDLLEIISPVQEKEHITQIQFTDENNLLVSIENNIEDKLRFALFELNLDNTSDTSKVNQLWSYTINCFDGVRHAQAVPFPNSTAKKIILIINSYKYNQETFLLTIQNSNYTIQKYNFYDIKQIPFSQVNKIIFCNNSLDVALMTGKEYSEEYIGRKPLHLLARNNNKENFIEQELPTQKYFNSYNYYKDLQFNKSGSICIYLNDLFDRNVVLLNKIAGKWYLAMYLTDSWHYGLSLTLDEKNIFVIKVYEDYNLDKISNCNLEVMSIEDKILTSVSAPVYTSGYLDESAIRYKNFHYLVKNIEERMTNLTVHPSGLAVFVHYNMSYDTKIKIIFPKQFTKLDTVKYLGSKVAHYLKGDFLPYKYTRKSYWA